jgi:hypothetical protein
MDIVVSQPAKTNNYFKKKYRTLTGFFRDCTFFTVFGEKTSVGVRPSRTKQSFIYNWNKGRCWGGFSAADFLQHQLGKTTLYYFGTPWIGQEFSLAMIDIDCHHKGTLQGAIKFAEFLKTNHFPDLKYETSTNGQGIHAYVLIQQIQLGCTALNQALNCLEKWLQTLTAGFDIELVEVKGHAPDIAWGDRNRDQRSQISSLRYGQFAKLPRNISLQDLINTQMISVDELRGRKYRVPDIESPDIASHDDQIRAAKCPSSGSIEGLFINQKELDRLPHYENIWMNQTQGELLKASHWQVSAMDGAIFLMVRKALKEPNCPIKRIMAFWNRLYELGHVNRPFNHHRLKAIRDCLSMNGNIKWISNEYWHYGEDQTKKGRACQWTLGDKLLKLMEVTAEKKEEGGASFMDTSIITDINMFQIPKWIRPPECQHWANRFNLDEINKIVCEAA